MVGDSVLPPPVATRSKPLWWSARRVLVHPNRPETVLVTDHRILLDHAGFSIPLLKPSVGAVWAERKTEVAEVRRALRRAKSVVIAGSGNAGIDMAGDVRQFVDVAGGCRVHLIVSGKRCYMPPTQFNNPPNHTYAHKCPLHTPVWIQANSSSTTRLGKATGRCSPKRSDSHRGWYYTTTEWLTRTITRHRSPRGPLHSRAELKSKQTSTSQSSLRFMLETTSPR